MILLHCGDFHLDARMESGLAPGKARERRVELLMAFSRVIEEGIAKGAEAVLLAGDLFDTARVSEKTRRYVGDMIAAHSSIPFFAVTGNHGADVLPLFPGDVTPVNWHLFPRGGWDTVYIPGGVAVSGTSSPEEPGIWERIPSPPPGAFHIVLLHGEVREGFAAGGDTLPLGLLRERGIRYLALGHEHSFRTAPLDREGTWAYAGCPEGRGFDECGPKGYVLIDTALFPGADVSPTFVPCARRIFHDLSVDLTDCQSFSEVQAKVEEAIAPLPADDMVRLTLTGQIPPDLNHDPTHVNHLITERFYYARLHDGCRLRLDPTQYQNDISLKGEFIRTVMASSLSDEEKERTVACGLRALRGEEVDA